jgi:hypothetical protein
MGRRRVPFTAEVADRFARGSEPRQPPGTTVLELAWQHRPRLLG